MNSNNYQIYQCWKEEEEAASLTFSTKENCEKLFKDKIIGTTAILLYEIVASSWEEARAKHHLMQGW